MSACLWWLQWGNFAFGPCAAAGAHQLRGNELESEELEPLDPSIRPDGRLGLAGRYFFNGSYSVVRATSVWEYREAIDVRPRGTTDGVRAFTARNPGFDLTVGLGYRF